MKTVVHVMRSKADHILVLSKEAPSNTAKGEHFEGLFELELQDRELTRNFMEPIIVRVHGGAAGQPR